MRAGIIYLSKVFFQAGLIPNTTYQRYIQPYNTAGSSNSATATKATLCKIPVSMTIASPSYTQLELNWDANGNSDGTKYIAHCSPDGFATVYSSTAIDAKYFVDDIQISQP